jgi:hypothetical protein
MFLLGGVAHFYKWATLFFEGNINPQTSIAPLFPSSITSIWLMSPS